MPKHPLVEVFGFPVEDMSDEAKRHRADRLCPYNNIVPSCTKDKVENPLGVCSIYEKTTPTIICPVRFRQAWHIASDAARFFFPSGPQWTSLSEVRLKDANGKSAGNIDLVLVAYDADGKVSDFGSLEVQGVYISGNLRRPFTRYMENPEANAKMDWSKEPNYPGPDYLSSSRKRLAPQLIYKGGIFHSWGKKMAVAIDKCFLQELPDLPTVSPKSADLCWFVYELKRGGSGPYVLTLNQTLYTKFNPVLEKITRANPGSQDDFKNLLQKKLDKKLSRKAAVGPARDIEDISDIVVNDD
jgi:hypothetical protein